MANMSKDEMVEIKDEYLVFLDELRESGVTNMFGASPYLTLYFPELDEDVARKILVHWMKTFSERHSNSNE